MDGQKRIDILMNGSNSQKLFATTVVSLSHSQGFYCHLLRDLEQIDEDEFNNLCKELDKQNFKDTLDVVMWLEA